MTRDLHWRGLEELEPGAEVAVEPSSEDQGVNRRDFVKLVGAGAALAGIVGCTQPPPDMILPYVRQPPEVVPGVPLTYATCMSVDGHAVGLLVTSHVGRPTKIEGNPDHPASLGAAGVREQASILSLYDPHRARAILHEGGPGSWNGLVKRLRAAASSGGAGLRILMEPTSSPHLVDLLRALGETLPEAKITFYAPLDRTAVWEGTRLAFPGERDPLEPIYDFSHADVVLALDANFLAEGPFHMRYAREFAERRRMEKGRMCRLYSVEQSFTVTGTMADHRLRTRAGDVANVAKQILSAIDSGAKSMTWADVAARDLLAHRGACVVVPGDGQPAAVHALAHLINRRLDGTVSYVPSVIPRGVSHDLGALVDEMRAGAVKTLLILDANPVYTAPGDLRFDEALAKVPVSVLLAQHENETSRACTDFVPAAHYLESWGDGRALDGTASIQQPLVRPFYAGRTPAEIISALLEDTPRSAYDIVSGYWKRRSLGVSWDEMVQKGVIPEKLQKARGPSDMSLDEFGVIEAVGKLPAPADDRLDVSLVPSALHDGRFANNGWLLELPDPMTKLTWDNAALVSTATARALGVGSGDFVDLVAEDGSKVRAPVLILPGHADQSVTLSLGYGRDGAEATARGIGVNAYPLLRRGARITPVSAHRAGGSHTLAITQTHWTMDGRALALTTTVDTFRAQMTEPLREVPESIMPVRPGEGPHYDTGIRERGGDKQWGMAIDLSTCTGCSACVVACQAENNTPTVGKENVLRSREMHWMRIDRYFVGEPEDPEVVHQPMLCQHCEKAPCEYVCPVNATVHSPDGLNEMAYNRCVGTRFCSNNCPYKVRRFNWFDFVDHGLVQLQKNPNVTVRERGVMEKCTFCVQRIRSVQIQKRVAGEPVKDGDVVTACQQACPSQAIVFGDLADPTSRIARIFDYNRAYEVLHDQGTKPRVRYLVRVMNPGGERKGG